MCEDIKYIKKYVKMMNLMWGNLDFMTSWFEELLVVNIVIVIEML